MMSPERWPERIDPLHEAPGVVAHHLKKYEFALTCVSGLVLDVACGVGYGTAYLSDAVDRIVGVEIDEGALEIARRRYLSDHVHFVRANAESLPFLAGSADAVVCFEGIEHFVDPEKHVAEVARVLKPDGVYLVSTPKPGAHPHGEENPFHLHELERDQLESILRDRFGRVEMLGQRRLQTEAHRRAQRLDVLGLRRLRLLRPLSRAVSRRLGTAPVDEASLEDFAIDDRVDEATEFVAVCRHPRHA